MGYYSVSSWSANGLLYNVIGARPVAITFHLLRHLAPREAYALHNFYATAPVLNSPLQLLPAQLRLRDVCLKVTSPQVSLSSSWTGRSMSPTVLSCCCVAFSMCDQAILIWPWFVFSRGSLLLTLPIHVFPLVLIFNPPCAEIRRSYIVSFPSDQKETKLQRGETIYNQQDYLVSVFKQVWDRALVLF